MFYEKKLLILSGEGTGAVLIEKSALGVNFLLRTFDLPQCGALKAGIITKTDVFVRELPPTGDAEITVECDDLSVLHFAVFDERLRLYGTNGKRMWEANVMELLAKHSAPIIPRHTELPALPPIVKKPDVLPLADGTGTVGSRLALYGDEAISDSDFYTPFELAPRLKEVDAFLDTPRVLEGLSPLLVPPERKYEAAEIKSEESIMQTDTDGTNTERDEVEPVFPQDEAAASAAGEHVSPWEAQARWLKKRGGRELRVRSVSPRMPPESVPHIRETDFYERVRADIDSIFSDGEKDGRMSELLSDFEWIKVETEGGTVSVGRGGGVLCYAIPGNYDRTAPLGKEAQWLPENRELPEGKGFWLLFQELSSGRILG